MHVELLILYLKFKQKTVQMDRKRKIVQMDKNSSNEQENPVSHWYLTKN